MGLVRQRLRDLRHDQRGSVTAEQVIVTALLAAFALAATAIIVAKFTAKATAIPTN
jgi:hypothetical protein